MTLVNVPKPRNRTKGSEWRGKKIKISFNFFKSCFMFSGLEGQGEESYARAAHREALSEHMCWRVR